MEVIMLLLPKVHNFFRVRMIYRFVTIWVLRRGKLTKNNKKQQQQKKTKTKNEKIKQNKNRCLEKLLRKS